MPVGEWMMGVTFGPVAGVLLLLPLLLLPLYPERPLDGVGTGGGTKGGRGPNAWPG